jgi:hypothetical protein
MERDNKSIRKKNGCWYLRFIRNFRFFRNVWLKWD